MRLYRVTELERWVRPWWVRAESIEEARTKFDASAEAGYPWDGEVTMGEPEYMDDIENSIEITLWDEDTLTRREQAAALLTDADIDGILNNTFDQAINDTGEN
jgi:hypothetical protein